MVTVLVAGEAMTGRLVSALMAAATLVAVVAAASAAATATAMRVPAMYSASVPAWDTVPAKATLPEAVTPAPASSSARPQVSVYGLAFLMTLNMALSIEPRPKDDSPWAAEVMSVGTPAATAPAARRWPSTRIL
jgi:hypothetical protein